MKLGAFLVLTPCLVVLAGCRGSSPQPTSEPAFTLKEIGPNVWAAISNPKSGAPAPANTGFVIGDDGVNSGEALAEAVMPGLRDRYSRWDGFQYAVKPNILETDAELRGTKRIPQANPAR